MKFGLEILFLAAKKLINKYAQDKLFVVSQNYVANEKLCQLQQSINDLIGLKIANDPSNQKHVWFVDNGDKEGFFIYYS